MMIDYKGMDIENDLGEFWVVTKPTCEGTELNDILFKTTVLDMGLQFLGGLRPEEVRLITHNEQKAKDWATVILQLHKDIEEL